MAPVTQLRPLAERCGTCAIRNRAVCAALAPQELARLNSISQRRSYEPGETILADEEEAGFLATVVSGVVKLTKLLPDGRQQILGLQFESDFLGRAFRPRANLQAEAATAVELCCFPRAAFEALLADSHDLEARLFRDALDELDAARDWMVLLGRQSAREKVARFLTMLARRAANIGCTGGFGGGGVQLDLPLSRADIADFLGLTIETVSRQMTRLKTEGLIRIETNRRIQVPSMSGLEVAAGG